MNDADSLLKQENRELKKEITRLQKLLAKIEAKKYSEIAALKVKLAESERNKIVVTISKDDAKL